MARSKVFISYSHEDERWRKRVVGHLGVLAMEGILELWDDRKIGAGDDWLAQLNQQMLDARIALLLVSSAFLTSKFIREREIPRLFSQHVNGGMVIYPLLLKPCPWQEVRWLARMQVRPADARPVASFRSAKVDEVLVAVAREISSIVKERAGKTRPFAGKAAGNAVGVQASGGLPEPGVSSAPATCDITGLWQGRIKEYTGPQGLHQGRCIFEFVVVGDQVLGTVQDGDHPRREVRDGRMSGDRVSFTALTEWNTGEPTLIALHGKVTGERINFVVQTPSWGMYSPSVQQFRAARVK